jgi:hypothetical protein
MFTSTLHIHLEFEGFLIVLSGTASDLLERPLNISSIGGILNDMEALHV